jgi:hypothetical protein
LDCGFWVKKSIFSPKPKMGEAKPSHERRTVEEEDRGISQLGFWIPDFGLYAFGRSSWMNQE